MSSPVPGALSGHGRLFLRPVSFPCYASSGPRRKSRSPSEDWMEVTAETGVKACRGVPMLLLALPRDTWSAEVPQGSEVGGARSMSIAMGSSHTSCTSCCSCTYSSSANSLLSVTDFWWPSALIPCSSWSGWISVKNRASSSHSGKSTSSGMPVALSLDFLNSITLACSAETSEGKLSGMGPSTGTSNER